MGEFRDGRKLTFRHVGPTLKEVEEAVLAEIRRLARAPGAVRLGGDSVSSMGGRGVDGRAAQHALAHAYAAGVKGQDVVCTGPTLDGEPLTIVLRIDGDTILVSNVVLL